MALPPPTSLEPSPVTVLPLHPRAVPPCGAATATSELKALSGFRQAQDLSGDKAFHSPICLLANELSSREKETSERKKKWGGRRTMDKIRLDDPVSIVSFVTWRKIHCGPPDLLVL
uniref:Uncharacterized protein n=1 Tax=Oryza sativa subsp. japonica TaxID=39947 RepID=Q69SM0_ORYSJ|nr:hypothetical protein [Oryza sativa Japonica Group]BAD36015.1 hypothetical protein [Oryza sativa Japonica Group]